jgi:hypothetical protein
MSSVRKPASPKKRRKRVAPANSGRRPDAGAALPDAELNEVAMAQGSAADSRWIQLRSEAGVQHTYLNPRLGNALPINDPKVLEEVVREVLEVSGRGGPPNEAVANRLLSMIVALQPRDTADLLLCMQQVIAHWLSVKWNSRVDSDGLLIHNEAALKMGNKLSRLFLAALDARNRHRHSGQQKIVVEHVTITNSRQTILENVRAPEHRLVADPVTEVAGEVAPSLEKTN